MFVFNPGGEGIDAVKVIAQGLGIVFHREMEGFLDGKTEFQCVHRVKAKTVIGKKRCTVVDVGGGDVFQPQLINDELF